MPREVQRSVCRTRFRNGLLFGMAMLLARGAVAAPSTATRKAETAPDAEEQSAPRPVTPPAPEGIRRPTWGKVIGWVLDASTRRPITGARVSVEMDGAFPEAGKGTDQTDDRGRYEAKAPLGKVSTKFDWGRVLSMHPISLLLSPRSVTKQTRLLEVTQANVRVEAEGYQPFVGRVRASRLDAGNFSITLDDVWLAPEPTTSADTESSKGKRVAFASFTPERLRREVIESFTVEPRIAAPKERVKITLRTRLPVERGYRYRAYVTSSAIRLVPDQLELKREKEPQEKDEKDQPSRSIAESVGSGTQVVFSKEIELPKRSADRWTQLGIILVRDDVTPLRSKETRALLQMVMTEEERPVAEKVATGFDRLRLNDREGALREFAAARKLSPGYPLAALLYGDTAVQAGRPQDAVGAYRQLVSLDSTDYAVARPRLALALLDTGKPDAALAELSGAEGVVGKKRVPGEVSLLRARVYAEQGKLDQADEWLAKAGSEVQIPAEMLSRINTRRLETALRSKPNDPELRQSYARMLEASGRREEAATEVRRAAELEPDQPWAFIDLGTTLRRLGRNQEGLKQLEHARSLAPNNLEAMLALADAYREDGRYGDALPLYQHVVAEQKLNLRARHFYALMLYATGDMERSRAEFFEVIAQARDKGELVEDGLLFPGASIYFGPKRRLVYGFSVPEAAADLTLLEALDDLKKHPDNGLLWQNIGAALLDLDLPRLALPALRRAQEKEDSLLETRFLIGLAHRRLGETTAARKELEAVIAANPLHPRARLELAQLFTDEGNFARAQSELLAHARNYPYERPARQPATMGG